MMKLYNLKEILTFILMSFFGLSMTAQPGQKKAIQLEGQVVDFASEVALEFVAISVFRTADSTLVDGSISNESGIFQFALTPDSYYLSLNYIGFQQKMVWDINLEAGQEPLDLGLITMSESALLLDEIEIVEERTQMELKLDKRVYNIGKDVSNAGGSASEVLDNLPSVQVDIEGNVSLRGSEGVRVLIDGKPSGLLTGGTDGLRQIPSGLIERVEIITNPSARYEAEGEVGIINIILKKEKQKGLNGTFGLTAGYPENFGANYGLNFRRKSLNFFSNFGLTYRKSPGGGSSFQREENDGIITILESAQDRSRGGLNGNLELGSDWFINETNTITASVQFEVQDGSNQTDYTFRDLSGEEILIQESKRLTLESEDSYDLETDLNYRKTFDDEDRLWTIDFKYIFVDELELADYSESSDTSNFLLEQRSSNTEDESRFQFQTDYAHPLGANAIAEVGAFISRRRIDNDFTVEEQESYENWEVLPGLDNYMIYLENIYAAYLIYGQEVGAFSYQLGLRGEYSDITTELVNTNDVNPRDYLNLFPTAHFTYKLSESHQFQLSYSRRINRPRFRHLLPFYGFGNNRNVYQGNPNLTPEFAHSMEAGYLNYYDKGSFLVSVYYRYRTDVIERILIPTGVGSSVRLPVNLATQHVYGLESNLSLDLFDWWRNNINLNFYRDQTEGFYEGQDLSAENFTWSARWNGRFKLPAKIDLQAAFNFQAPRTTTQGRNLAMYHLDAGLTRDILNGNGTIILSVRDVFNSRRWRGITDLPGFYREQEFQWRARQFLVTFNYRLNRKKRDGDLFRGGGGDGM